MNVSWEAALCTIVQSDWRFRSANYFSHQGDTFYTEEICFKR